MAAKFHDISVLEVQQETPHARVVRFDIPEALKADYDYKPGQYVTVELEVNGENVRRAYSLCSSPYEDVNPAVGVKKVEGGKASTYINETLKAGDTVRLMPPMGNFIHVPDPTQKKQYVFFAGGSGITPIMSIIRSTLPKEINSSITLIYCNRNESHIMFREQLEQLAAQYDNFTLIHNLDSAQPDWTGELGQFSKQKALDLLNKFVKTPEIAEYYICGPSGLMAAIDDALAEKGIIKDRIHKEFFSAPLKSEPADVEGAEEPADSPLEEAELVITVDGEEHTIEYKGEMSILEAALDNDVDAPYACQVGACCTCRAMLKQGKVHMEDREALSDEEIEEGYILTCQSTPLTGKLVYSYDE